MSSQVIVMQRGRAVEIADSDALYGRPEHAYIKELLAASPHLDDALAHSRARGLSLFDTTS